MQQYTGLDKKFDVVSTTPIEVGVLPSTDQTVEDDAEHARKTIKDMIEQGKTAVDGIINIAGNSDAPRAYEVAGQLIKTVGELAKDLLEIQKRKKDIGKAGKAAKIGTQNNLFVGSTADLMKALNKLPAEEVSEDI